MILFSLASIYLWEKIYQIQLKTSFLIVLFLISTQTFAQENVALMRVGMLKDKPPLSFIYPDDVAKKPNGIAVELAHMLNTALGAETEIVTADLASLYRMLAEGEIDYICGLPANLI